MIVALLVRRTVVLVVLRVILVIVLIVVLVVLVVLRVILVIALIVVLVVLVALLAIFVLHGISSFFVIWGYKKSMRRFSRVYTLRLIDNGIGSAR